MDDEINNEMKSLVLDEVDKLKEKMQKLENQVGKIMKDNQNLSAKVNKLETIIENLTNSNSVNKKHIKTDVNQHEETWLYYITKGIDQKKITDKLEVSNDSQILEMNVEIWEDERSMLKNILSHFSIIHDFPEYKNMSNKELKSTVKKILGELISLDLVFILRNLPKKSSISYDLIMSNIATFSGIIYNTYEEMEDNDEALGKINLNKGKIALVLESDEDLQILNVVKNNTRMILFVEPLFRD